MQAIAKIFWESTAVVFIDWITSSNTREPKTKEEKEKCNELLESYKRLYPQKTQIRRSIRARK
jgi:hypothetical protein